MSTVSNLIFDFDQVTTENNSIFFDLLSKENNCFDESDEDSIFQEISRLAEKSNPNESRSVEDIIKEAESLIEEGCKNKVSKGKCCVKSEKCFDKVCETVQPDSVISEESTPKLVGDTTTNYTNYDTEADVATLKDEENDDSIDEITDGMDIDEINSNDEFNVLQMPFNSTLSKDSQQVTFSHSTAAVEEQMMPNPLTYNINSKIVVAQEDLNTSNKSLLLNNNEQLTIKPTFCDKSTNSSPKRVVSVLTSPIAHISVTREHALQYEIEQLQETLKDTEERLQSLRIQHDSLTHIHRDVRENQTHLQEESELLKLDVQHLNECANILRTELQSARKDRNEALELQKTLQGELDDYRVGKKRLQERTEIDSKVIQDLQRQCKEMERILVRKHPDSVSALIVASKNCKPTKVDPSGSRKLLEQRIAQLESDAKEQDLKAQKILANVQQRFNSVQAKYETHIADLETQVLSLQEINSQLNEEIESQRHLIDELKYRRRSEHSLSISTQTEEFPEKQGRLVDTSSQTEAPSGIPMPHSGSSRSSSASRRSGLRAPGTPKMPVSQSDNAISSLHLAAKEDAHLLATIRGMRVDLAIKDKAMQRLTRELDECKKTIRKLQKERESLRNEKQHSLPGPSSSISRKSYDPALFSEQLSDTQALKEALNKIKLLEFDYKSLYDKRIQDLKTLQTAHERELTSCHETVRILQERLTERDQAFVSSKERKVSSLERRHTEREERLHMLVEALSKGRLNGPMEDIMKENNSRE
ncbi:CEP162 family protein [Megaselia abdita]